MAIPVKTYITQGSATPFPHILYSAVSECGWLNHLMICSRVLGRLFLLINCRCVSHTLSQKLISSSEGRSEEHTSELQSRGHLVCRLLLEKKKELDWSRRVQS